MRRLPRSLLLPKRSLATNSNANHAAGPDRPSFGFSGAGFLGCYHVGVAACLRRHGLLPRPDDADDGASRSKASPSLPLLTGVSAGSMIASSIAAGVDPETDGMEVVLEAARRTRELSSPHLLTPGFSLIDQVEGPFRDAMARALGGYCEKADPSSSNDNDNKIAIIRDIDPELFARRFPNGSVRIGLTDRRMLWPPVDLLSRAYRYVDAYRNLEDVIACCMLSSYIPGGTGLLKLEDKVPEFLGRMLKSSGDNSHFGRDDDDASARAGVRLREMTRLGLVRHGKTGLPVESDDAADDVKEAGEELSGDYANNEHNDPTAYWDGGLADMFPTFDSNTVIVSPLSGSFGPNPSISPQMLGKACDDATNNKEDGSGGESGFQRQQQQLLQSTTLMQRFLRPYLPTTFRHCPKSELGLNAENARAALKMIFTADDDEYHLIFQEGYDDASRFVKERGQSKVFTV